MVSLYHGTDTLTASAFLHGARLSDGAAASRKKDGQPGFFLAVARSDAEFFAARREPGAIIEFTISEEAVRMLTDAGATVRRIAVTPRSPYFVGDEFVVPPGAFGVFNELLDRGEIRVGV